MWEVPQSSYLLLTLASLNINTNGDNMGHEPTKDFVPWEDIKELPEWKGEKATIRMYEKLYRMFKIKDGGAAHKRLQRLQNIRRYRRIHGYRNDS